ncbi:MAG TPA: hypothetical protein VN442_03775 [Bryobacteraceae bacterium]|nr:hypothetical protein [Bryobacteraceae bacterium]
MNDADIAQFVRMLASEPAEEPLPDASAIWAKAALRRRLDAGERATRAVRYGEIAAASVAIVASVLLFPTGALEAVDPAVVRLCGLGLAVLAAVSAVFVRFLWAER